MSDAEMAALARRQHGLVTALQAETFLTIDQIRYRLRAERLERVHPGVMRIAGAPEGWDPALMAAVLASGDGAVGAFRAAAYLWGLAGFWEAPPIEIMRRPGDAPAFSTSWCTTARCWTVITSTVAVESLSPR
ncbi:MAG: hypothetical protein FJW95_14150 [Actinobacteria bacterium]|nr:hypothetical protein [Actinomycetota bacterium]